MRPLADVRQAILNVVEDETTRQALQDNTEGIIDSLPYSAPEIIPERWSEFTYEMACLFTEPMKCGTNPQDTEWGQKAINILNHSLDYREFLN